MTTDLHVVPARRGRAVRLAQGPPCTNIQTGPPDGGTPGDANSRRPTRLMVEQTKRHDVLIEPFGRQTAGFALIHDVVGPRTFCSYIERLY